MEVSQSIQRKTVTILQSARARVGWHCYDGAPCCGWLDEREGIGFGQGRLAEDCQPYPAMFQC